MLLFFRARVWLCRWCFIRFNTSHVVVFPGQSMAMPMVLYPFQYISCCCFSDHGGEYRIRTAWFQYISCCCFSHDFSLFFHFIISDSPLFFKPFFVFYQPYHLPLCFPHKYVKLLVTISFFDISYISAPGKKLAHIQIPIFPC